MIASAHSHAFLNYWSLYCTHQSHPVTVVLQVEIGLLSGFFMILESLNKKEDSREKCVALASTGQPVLSARSLHHLVIGEGEDRLRVSERERERESKHPGSSSSVLNYEARLTY